MLYWPAIKAKKQIGMKCCNNYCGNRNEHAEPNFGEYFLCYGCKSNPVTCFVITSRLSIEE